MRCGAEYAEAGYDCFDSLRRGCCWERVDVVLDANDTVLANWMYMEDRQRNDQARPERADKE